MPIQHYLFLPAAPDRSPVTTTDFASASVTYGYNFTRDLTAQLTYRYQHRFASSGTTTIDPITGIPTVAGTGPASSNSIMLTVTNNYIVLPHGKLAYFNAARMLSFRAVPSGSSASAFLSCSADFSGCRLPHSSCQDDNGRPQDLGLLLPHPRASLCSN